MKYQFNEKKLGTTIEIIIIEGKKKEKEIIDNISLLWLFIDEFENEFSRFRDNSMLNKLNRGKYITVSNRFLDILAKSINIYRFTNNYFNPLLNLKNIWYSNNFTDNSFKIVKEEMDLNLDEIKIKWNDIYLKSDQNLDFGWIAKWYLVDELSRKLEEFWYNNYIVNAWWDIYMRWINDEGNKWGIGIENPYGDGYIWIIELSNFSISTSGSYKRHWTIEWKNYHHIVNPINLENETSLVWITIIAPKCYISDTLATAIFCMWIEKWKEFMIKNWIDWILFGKNKDIFLTPNFRQKYSFTYL